MDKKQGFGTIQVSAGKLIEHGIPFSVLLEGNEVKGYVTYRNKWSEVEKSHAKDWSKWSDKSGYKPLLSWNDDLLNTIKEMNWIMVGDL